MAKKKTKTNFGQLLFAAIALLVILTMILGAVITYY
jgi:hypothetical protein